MPRVSYNFPCTEVRLPAVKKATHDMFLGAGGHLFEMARTLRRQETDAEKFLWTKLCNQQLGVKFRRQHPIYDYIADFYCHSHRLVIEVDGSVHNTIEAKVIDEERTVALAEFQIDVIRFTNEEVLHHVEEVIRKIKWHLDEFQKL